MASVIDTNTNTSGAVACLKDHGVAAIIRYYNRDRTPKVIKKPEFDAILAAGLSLCIVHQRNGRSAAEFSAQSGKLDARHCREYGAQLGQPSGSAIYFGVDFDISRADLTRHVVPFFEAIRDEMASGGPLPSYRVGVYGSGMTCSTILDRGLAQLTWLSQSRRFTGTPEFRASNRWSLVQMMPERLCGINIDPDIVNPAQPDFGQFRVGQAGPQAHAGHGAQGAARKYRVIGRGLRLRSGPGTEFDVVGSLEFGRIVDGIDRGGDWLLIDAQGDGRIDGAAHSHFLEPV